MYFLLSHQPNVIKSMQEKFESHIQQVGTQYVTDKERLRNPVEFITGLFAMKKKYDLIVVKSFYNNEEFWKALNSAFEKVTNTQKRMAEYLSLFLDYKIRTAKDNENIEEHFDNAMVLFKYMQDKDIFESYYKIHLSKRLLMSRSEDSIKDIERLFVAKLKVTNNLKLMVSIACLWL